MKSAIIFTAILLGCMLSVLVVVTFKGYITYQAKSLKLAKERFSYQDNECFKNFNTKKTLLLLELKNETISCMESADQLGNSVYQNEFYSKIKEDIQKIFDKCDSKTGHSEHVRCISKFTNESQFMKEIEKTTTEVSQKIQNVDKAEHDCLSKNIGEIKVKKASTLSDLQNCLLGKSEPILHSFDLDKLKNIYKTLKSCAINRLRDFDTCLEESESAVSYHKEQLIETSAESFEEINTFDQNEDACLRHFIIGMVSTELDCTHDFLKSCLIRGYKKSIIKEIDEENLINEYWNLQNALLACRVDYNKTLIEKCISETLLDSNEARYIGCNIRTISKESLQNHTNKIHEVLNNETHCYRYIFEEIKFRGLFMDGAVKEGYKECMDKYYVSNTDLPTLKNVVNKLKTIETAFIKCSQYLNVPSCLAEIISANERSLVYIETNFVQFQGLSVKMLKCKHNGGVSALKDLQTYLQMDSALTFDLYELNKMYKSVKTCVKDGKADFSKCMEVSEKLKNKRDHLIEISEKYSEKINNFDLQENSCFRHFITKIVYPDFNPDLADCLENGFKENANEKLIEEFENLQNALSACRVDFNRSNIEKCISEKLNDSNEVQTLLHTSSGENLKKLKSEIDEVFDTENDCIGYVFEKLLFRGLFMNNLTKNNFKICMDKRYVANTETVIEKDAISKFKTISISLNGCYRYNRWLPEISRCVAEIIDANENSLDIIGKSFDKMMNSTSAFELSEPNFKCLSEIMSRKDNKSCSNNMCTYPDISRCLRNWIYVFEPNDIEVREKQLNVRYSVVPDIYERYIKEGSHVTVIDTYQTWQSAKFYSNNIWRYLYGVAYFLGKLNYTSETAEIAWKFDFSKANLKVKDFSLRFDNTTLGDGVLEVLVQNSEGSKEVIGSKDLAITAKLHTPNPIGQRWMNAQLFRQHMNTKDFPFDLNVELC